MNNLLRLKRPNFLKFALCLKMKLIPEDMKMSDEEKKTKSIAFHYREILKLLGEVF